MKQKITRNFISSEALLSDLKRVGININNEAFSYKVYKKNSGKHCLNTFVWRFGNWDSSMKNAGLKSISMIRHFPTKIEIIEDMQRVTKELGTEFLSLNVYLDNQGYNYHHIKAHLYNWSNALKEAGLKKNYEIPFGLKPSTATKKDVIEDLQRVAIKFKNRHMRIIDYLKYGKYTRVIIARHLNNWSEALEKAGVK